MIWSLFTRRVLSLPRFAKRLIVFSLDLFLCVIATAIAFYLRLGEFVRFFSDSDWMPHVAATVSIVISIPIFIATGLYREIFRHSGWSATLILLRAIVVYSLLYLFIFTIIGFNGVPRTIGIIQPIILFILISSTRGLASFWLSNPYRYELKIASIPKVLIYGAGNAGMQLCKTLAQDYKMQVVGYLDDDPEKQGRVLGGKPIYRPEDVQILAAKLDISLILLAIPSASRYRRNQIISLVRKAKVAIQTIPNINDLVEGRLKIQDIHALDIDDLLCRDLVLPDLDLLAKNTLQKNILITGAGGSIGSELCRQLLELKPRVIVLIEQSEFALYQIHRELSHRLQNIRMPIELIPILASVTNTVRMRNIIQEHNPHIIYHAAAYKHVPLVEQNILDGVRNNVFGTLTLAKIAVEHGVQNFVLISTDKAVRPTNVMGASKRVAEMILQAISANRPHTKFSMVRFGNVLNSSGSVVPIFQKQIFDGGPITITDYRITRFFMTIPEAAQLVIQAGALAQGGEVFLLDMGEPIKIFDLAKRMIELSGLKVRDLENPNGDIEIKDIGLRPGEKLYEELLIDGLSEPTIHPRIFMSRETFLEWELLEVILNKIDRAIEGNLSNAVIDSLQELVSGFQYAEAHNLPIDSDVDV